MKNVKSIIDVRVFAVGVPAALSVLGNELDKLGNKSSNDSKAMLTFNPKSKVKLMNPLTTSSIIFGDDLILLTRDGHMRLKKNFPPRSSIL